MKLEIPLNQKCPRDNGILAFIATGDGTLSFLTYYCSNKQCDYWISTKVD